ncbi:hypothetical protein QQ045_023617 [Rhodiola kirilowii]
MALLILINERKLLFHGAYLQSSPDNNSLVIVQIQIAMEISEMHLRHHSGNTPCSFYPLSCKLGLHMGGGGTRLYFWGTFMDEKIEYFYGRENGNGKNLSILSNFNPLDIFPHFFLFILSFKQFMFLFETFFLCFHL